MLNLVVRKGNSLRKVNHVKRTERKKCARVTLKFTSDMQNWDSSVGTVSRLRKDNRGRVVLRRNKWLYLMQSVHTDSGAHQASHSTSIRDSFIRGAKRNTHFQEWERVGPYLHSHKCLHSEHRTTLPFHTWNKTIFKECVKHKDLV